MPIRVRKFRPKVLIALPLLGVWAGLAVGSLNAGAESASRAVASPVGTPALAATVSAGPAADALAADDAGSLSGATADPASPAAALVPADRRYLEPILAQAAREYGLPVDLILAQAWVESGWRTDAVSHKGAVGVLQLMPDAVDFVSTRLLKVDHPLDPRDPAANAEMGARFMRHLLDRLDGDVRQALIAYNQGLAKLRRQGPVPGAETYADRVLALRPVFAGGVPNS